MPVRRRKVTLTIIDHYHWTYHHESCQVKGFAPSCISRNHSHGPGHHHTQMLGVMLRGALAVTTITRRSKRVDAYQRQTSVSSIFSTHCVHRSWNDPANMAYITINRDRWNFVSFGINTDSPKNDGAIITKKIRLTSLSMLLTQASSPLKNAFRCSGAQAS